MRRKLVAGNWKMNLTRSSVQALVDAIRDAPGDGCDVAIFPPYVYLAELVERAAGSRVRVGSPCAALPRHPGGGGRDG